MKKLWINMMLLIVATSVRATIIASDDFSGGTPGNVIDNVAVQSGTGVWTTNYTATAGGVWQLQYAAGGYAIPGVGSTTGGNAALSNSALAGVTGTLKVSAEFSARNDKADGGSWAIGLYETLSKAYLQNETADDFAGFRFITSGANEGKLVWRIYDEGVAQNTTFAGNVVSFGATDVVRLSLSYNFINGTVLAEAYNVTQDSLINSATTTLTTLSGFQYAGIGFSTFTVDGTDPTRVTNFQVESIPEPATIGMLGLGALAAMMMRRICY
jgi:hypothetical protein